MDSTQFTWLENNLKANSSRYLDANGQWVNNPGGSDRLALLIEAREGFTQAGLPRLRADLKQFLNLSPEITVLKEGELPRPPGKSVRVVDRR